MLWYLIIAVVLVVLLLSWSDDDSCTGDDCGCADCQQSTSKPPTPIGPSVMTTRPFLHNTAGNVKVPVVRRTGGSAFLNFSKS